MVQQTIHERARPIAIGAEGPREFFLIHGYTGSPSDFNHLPALLHDRFEARVYAPRLVGHGTRVEDLSPLRLTDFIANAEHELRATLRQGKRIVIGGHSFGGQLALFLAARYPVSAVFATALPYRLRFPLWLPGMGLVAKLRPAWPKRLPRAELAERAHAFH